MLVYCDSMILIYLLDTIGPFNVRAAGAWRCYGRPAT